MTAVRSGFLKRFALMLLMAFSVVGMSIDSAEAARLGGGRSTGMQRTIPQRQAMPPAYQRPAPAPQPIGAPASGGWRKWAAPLAGLAAGIGLASLLSHFGMGGDMAGIVLALLAVVVVFALLRRLAAPRQQQPATYGGPSWQQQEPVQSQYGSQQAAYGGSVPASANIPADFDVEGFTHQAKVNFIRLQAANDAGNIEDIREFTSPEMFAEIKLDLDERRGAPQKTDVVSLDAQVLEVVEDAGRYITSVRFHGLLREAANSSPMPFDEVWHLTKPRDGSRGWVLAGIQQVA